MAIAAAVVAACAGASAVAFTKPDQRVIVMTEEQIAACADGGGCALLSRAGINQLIDMARAAGVKSVRVACGRDA